MTIVQSLFVMYSWLAFIGYGVYPLIEVWVLSSSAIARKSGSNVACISCFANIAIAYVFSPVCSNLIVVYPTWYWSDSVRIPVALSTLELISAFTRCLCQTTGVSPDSFLSLWCC